MNNKITTQSMQLKNFYQLYQQWLDAGAPKENTNRFDRGEGMCVNLQQLHRDIDVQLRLAHELKGQFHTNGLSWTYPFGKGNFHERWLNGTCHECPKRRAWVYMMCGVPGV